MKKKAFKVLTTIAVTGSLLATGTGFVSEPAPAAYAAETAQAPSVYIAPIDRAKFLAGSLFDFHVELNHLTTMPSSVTITVNGKDAEPFFGKPFVKTNTDKSQEFTIRDVKINEPGTYEVSVKADNGLAKTVKYEVVLTDQGGKKAKNVILFVGDGMAFPDITMSRIMSRGITEGKYNSLLEMDNFDQRAVVTTSGMDALVTDSANSASAYNTGHKSAVNGLGIYPDNTESSLDDPKVETLAEMLKRTRGMSVGVVTTSEIEDATPAAVVSHTRRRSDKPEIAEMLYKLQPEVILGGGSAYFLPKSTPGSKRKDEKNLFDMFQQKGYTIAENATQLKAANAPDKLLGLFHTADMSVYYDRSTNNKAELKSFTDQPNLWDMTQKALDTLNKNDKGFFLMVEGASIDKQLHPLDWERAAYDTIEMDKAIGVAKRFAEQNGETMIVVTADHSHSVSVAGTYWEGDGKSGREAFRTYEDSKFPTYVDSNGDGFPDTPDVDRKLAVVFGSHPDYYEDYKFDAVPTSPTVKNKDGQYVANPAKLANPDDPNRDRFLRPGTISSADSQGVHTADDVPLMAYGPGSQYFKGTMDNTDVFFGMANALGLNVSDAKSDGKNWIPLANFVHMMGGTVKYEASAREITIQINDGTILLNLNSGKATKNGKDFALEHRFENGTTFVSGSSILEVLAK
ncbi:alkaline phosphatase [Paenibacillus sp. MZ04-78.2]|uniref:alkaline phosphatase n=1 Tax=Paenibacillus sp. MZ04-78.2 TaxID=2962034 RepID=UPI0020B683DC|nr:alkaline phosphatase [Paenibacillus sp. MZ04-78.2]MCP3773018.1 alkaline phosphatase [Paenibacillus sp. MZ04-78.2]